MLEINKEWRHKKIVLISPHSDDVSVNIGGAVLVLAKNNKITPLLFYAGFRGVTGVSEEEGTRVREKEMESESRVLGIEAPRFLRLKTYLKDDTDAFCDDQEKLKKVFLKIDPDIIFLPQRGDEQPRHRLATKLTLEALKSVKKKAVLYYYESVWSIFPANEFNAIFCYNEDVMQEKMEAIRVHVSQLARSPFDRAAMSLASFRACVTPEQRLASYGKTPEKYAPYFECFKKEER